MKWEYIYIVIIGLLANSCTRTHFIGTWRVESKGELEKSEFAFYKNGTLQRTDANKKVHIDSWELSSKRNEITLSNQNQANAKSYQIKYMDGVLMVLNEKDNSYTLIRQLKVKSYNYTQAQNKLRGTWDLVQLEDQELAVGNNLQITFWNNGAYQQVINGMTQIGQWVLDEKVESVTLSSAEGEQVYGINFRKSDKIELIDSYGSYLFDKTDKVKKSPSNKKIEKQIIGAWTIQKIGKKDLSLDYTMYLYNDSVLKIYEDQQATKVGQWSVTLDGSFLFLQYGETKELYPIEKITAKKLQIKDELQSILFKKVIKL